MLLKRINGEAGSIPLDQVRRTMPARRFFNLPFPEEVQLREGEVLHEGSPSLDGHDLVVKAETSAQVLGYDATSNSLIMKTDEHARLSVVMPEVQPTLGNAVRSLTEFWRK